MHLPLIGGFRVTSDQPVANQLNHVLRKNPVKPPQLFQLLNGMMIPCSGNTGENELHTRGRNTGQKAVSSGIEAALFVPPEMAIEIVSANWEEDDQKKVARYAAFGVGEYWIVDPLALLDRYPNCRNPQIQLASVQYCANNGIEER